MSPSLDPIPPRSHPDDDRAGDAPTPTVREWADRLTSEGNRIEAMGGEGLVMLTVDEARQLVASLLDAQRRCDEGFRAHAASFGALQAISMRTDLEGEVDDYEDVVKAVERRLLDAQRDGTETALRRAWWLSHGCGATALYGDDGEMACNQCGADFLRWAPNDISARIKNERMLGAARAAPASPSIAPGERP